MMHLCGYVPDVPDPRDYSFAELLPRLGSPMGGSEYVLLYNRPARDQIGPSCVGHGVVRAIEILCPELPTLSGRALWYLARQATGQAHINGGTYIRTGLGQLQRVGAPSQAADPETDPYDAGLRPGALLEAHDHRGGDYFRIAQGDLAAVDRAIRSGQPVVVGGNVDDAFAEARAGTILTEPTGHILGGHATCLVGVRGAGSDLQVLVDNSWGARWGSGGRCWANAAWLASRWDLWAVTRGVE